MINLQRSKAHSASLAVSLLLQRLTFSRGQRFCRFLYCRHTVVAVIALWMVGIDTPWSAAQAAAEIDQLPVRGEWVRTSEVPLSARSGVTVAWNGTEIFVFGGTQDMCLAMGAASTSLCMPPAIPPLSDGAAYNPKTDTWSKIAGAPVSIITARTASLGTDIFVLAWTSYTERSIRLLRYQSTSDSWNEFNLPEILTTADIIAFGDDLILYTSTDEVEPATDWHLDTATGEWTQIADDPLSPGFGRQYVAVDDDLYLFDHEIVPSPGGVSGPSYLRAARLREQQWALLPTADSIGSAPSLIAGGLLFAPELGCADGGNTNGYDRCIPYGAVFDTTTDTWWELPNAPERGTKHVMSSGGLGDNGLVLSQSGYPALNATNNDWFIVPQLDSDGTIQRQVQAAGPYGFAFGGASFANGGAGKLLNEAWIWRPRN